MDLNFYSGLPDGCAQNVDSEFLGNQTYGGYTEGNKVTQTHFFGKTSKGGGGETDLNKCQCLKFVI